MNTGIFVDPSPELAALIVARKTAVRARWPDAAYLAHPPHCTLIAGEFSAIDRWIPTLMAALARVEPFAIETAGAMTFTNDPMTGGTTIAISVAESPALRALQGIVAGVLAPWRDIAATERLAATLRGAPADSARAFGSAWVGPHWLPHFTIASLTVEESDIPRALLEDPATCAVRIAALSIWRIEGDAHTRLAAARLGTPRENHS